MKKIINLHPRANSGESTTAIISSENRVLELELTSMGYGQHMTKTMILFDSPADMVNFAMSMLQVANSVKDSTDET